MGEEDIYFGIAAEFNFNLAVALVNPFNRGAANFFSEKFNIIQMLLRLKCQ